MSSTAAIVRSRPSILEPRGCFEAFSPEQLDKLYTDLVSYARSKLAPIHDRGLSGDAPRIVFEIARKLQSPERAAALVFETIDDISNYCKRSIKNAVLTEVDQHYASRISALGFSKREVIEYERQTLGKLNIPEARASKSNKKRIPRLSSETATFAGEVAKSLAQKETNDSQVDTPLAVVLRNEERRKYRDLFIRLYVKLGRNRAIRLIQYLKLSDESDDAVYAVQDPEAKKSGELMLSAAELSRLTGLKATLIQSDKRTFKDTLEKLCRSMGMDNPMRAS